MELTMKRKRGLASRIQWWTTLCLLVSAVFMAGLVLWNNQSNQAASREIEVHFQRQSHLQELDRLSHDMFSSYRAYLAYGRTDFLNGLFESVDQILSGLSEVHTAYALEGSSEQDYADQVEYIASMLRDLRDSMELGIQYKEDGDLLSLDQLSQTRVIPAVNSINERFKSLLDKQNNDIVGLFQANKQRSLFLLLVPGAMILLTALTGYYLVYYIRRTIVAPVLYVSEAVSRIAEGHYDQTIDYTERADEIGYLQRGVLAMTEDLQKRERELADYNRELINQRDLLEAQNEEIHAQQEEQQVTLLKLTNRERELEMISTYQEKLTGFLDLDAFLEEAVPQLLRVVGADGAAVVLVEGPDYETGLVVHASGFAGDSWSKGGIALYGPASRVVKEKKALVKLRGLTDKEREGLPLYERALDLFTPLVHTDQSVYGFLLLTLYGSGALVEQALAPNRGVLTQFALALQAQLSNEDRLRQADLMRQLNEELTREKQLLQTQRDLIRQVNETIHEGMLMLDGSKRILFSNKRMTDFFGYVFEEGHTLDDFCSTMSQATHGDCSMMRDQVDSMLEGHTKSIHERFTADGPEGTKHYELYINELEDGLMQGQGFLMVFRDRTEEEKVDEMKNEFVSIVSHELRTPLSSVLGFVEIMLHRTVSEEKQKRYLETIHSEANRLSNLINDFLDLQRMESGKQVYQQVPVDMAELVRHVADGWQDKNGHALQLSFEEDRMFALVDTDRIMQVLHNLISNAVKYSPGEETVDIRAAREGEWIRLEVEDYGLGIPEEAKARLFTKFYRVDNTDRRQIGGTGLGLAIVKEIVEAHNGSLSFESELGKGTVFTVRLPAYRHQDLAGRVVILEDDANLASMIAASFEKIHLPTVRVSSAEDALYSLDHSEGAPLLCIVDIQLQGVRSGWDFIAELTRHPQYKDTPVIVSTVLEQPSHFYESGKGRFLRKPFSIGRLLELAKELIGERAAGAVVFPMQNEERIASTLENNGMKVKQMTVRSDIIEVDIE